MAIGLTLHVFVEPSLALMVAPAACQLAFLIDYSIFTQLRDVYEEGTTPLIKVEPIPEDFALLVYSDEEGLTPTRTDGNEDALTCVRAEALKALQVTNKLPRNFAIKAFIDALPDDAIIVLYWS